MKQPEPRVITAAQAGELRLWQAPDMDAVAAAVVSRSAEAGTPVRFRPVAEIEAMEREAREQAHAEGYATGLAQGLAEGQAQAQARLARLDETARLLREGLEALAEPLRLMDDEVVAQLSALAIAVARQVLRHELRTDPAQVIGLVRETVGLLPVATREVIVHLHPEDARLLRERLAPTEGGPAWQIAEDPVLTRGGCRIQAGATQVDARVETRLNAALAAVLGTDRGAARSVEGA
ncbi:MAG: hypothetical protein RL026_759 [Pseudomonadota bacterium]|jgi:flagellar assembly protein FliH